MLQGEHSAILSTFIKLTYAIKIFVLSIFEWPFYTGFTVQSYFVYASSEDSVKSAHMRRPAWVLAEERESWPRGYIEDFT